MYSFLSCRQQLQIKPLKALSDHLKLSYNGGIDPAVYDWRNTSSKSAFKLITISFFSYQALSLCLLNMAAGQINTYSCKMNY